MARVKIMNSNPQTLDDLIPVYGEKNTECNALKKEVSALNDQIKTQIKADKKVDTDIVANGWKCKLAIIDKSDFNEDKLLQVAKAHGIDIVRTKTIEFIDHDELERLMYNGKIADDVLLELDKCIERNVTERLTVTKLKEAKDGE